jgi:hypothetical protein
MISRFSSEEVKLIFFASALTGMETSKNEVKNKKSFIKFIGLFYNHQNPLK